MASSDESQCLQLLFGGAPGFVARMRLARLCQAPMLVHCTSTSPSFHVCETKSKAPRRVSRFAPPRPRAGARPLAHLIKPCTVRSGVTRLIQADEALARDAILLHGRAADRDGLQHLARRAGHARRPPGRARLPLCGTQTATLRTCAASTPQSARAHCHVRPCTSCCSGAQRCVGKHTSASSLCVPKRKGLLSLIPH